VLVEKLALKSRIVALGNVFWELKFNRGGCKVAHLGPVILSQRPELSQQQLFDLYILRLTNCRMIEKLSEICFSKHKCYKIVFSELDSYQQDPDLLLYNPAFSLQKFGYRNEEMNLVKWGEAEN